MKPLILFTVLWKDFEDGQGDARIDQEPVYEPVFHVPVTAARKADSSIAARRASGGSDTALVHVPEYSALPETVALHAPFHDCGDLLADHPPCIRILPDASWSTHLPVALPSS
ncbi:MAG TPA: hypothetical protein VK687_07765 [Bryobacteraceae bacterium]|nr:hypothetical protein [Bryobacteraceae bacterium]